MAPHRSFPAQYLAALSIDADFVNALISGNLPAGSADFDASGGDTDTLAEAETFTTDNMSGVAVDAYGLIA